MEKLPPAVVVFTVVTICAIGLAACDAAPPPEASVAPTTESESMTSAETAVDVVFAQLAGILREPDPYLRAGRLAALLPTLGPEAVPAVVQALEDPMLDRRGGDYELLLRYWATHQPEAAVLWVKQEMWDTSREGAIFAALTTWAEADPRAAIDASWPWTLEPDRMYHRVVVKSVVRGWHARSETDQLLQWMRSLDAGTLRQRVIAVYALITIQQQGLEAAIAWAESVPDDGADGGGESYKQDVFRRTMDTVARFDIARAARWCDVHCYGPYGNNLRSILARDWVRQDGPAGMAWLKGTRADIERDQSVRHAYALWTRRGRDAAVAWFEAQAAAGDTEWLKTVYPVYARLIVREDPVEAMRWMSRIEDEAERELRMIAVAQVWRDVDEAAAEEWLLQSPLSEEARARARTPAKQLPGLPMPGGSGKR